jgi:hypothetical protein
MQFIIANEHSTKQYLEATFELSFFAYVTNLGPHQMARHLQGTLYADQIAHINRRHIAIEKLDAVLRDVINCFNRYTLPRYWGESKRAAADGHSLCGPFSCAR